MVVTDPTLDDYLNIATIYTNGELTREQLLAKAGEHQQADKCNTLTLGFRYYLRQEFNVPLQFYQEICKLGRKLSHLEVEALLLKEKIQNEPRPSVHISIDGLE